MCATMCLASCIFSPAGPHAAAVLRFVLMIQPHVLVLLVLHVKQWQLHQNVLSLLLTASGLSEC